MVQQYKSVKRFGARYGRKIRLRLGKIEEQQKKLYKCPYCKAQKVKREAAGIWKCKRCGAVYTAKAYSGELKVFQ